MKKAAKGKDRPTEFSRVGVRAYARGRAYDPNRYPVTPYRDPQDVQDEAELENTLSQKGILPQQEEVPETVTEAVNETVTENAPESTSSEELFQEINNEINGGEEE
jgi:YidC/Oxa1 family membrane protein insertase